MTTISIIMPIRNCVGTVREAVESVLAQDVDYELIVIDGASTDGTVQEIEPYVSRIAYFVSEADRGMEDAILKGVDRATSEWLMILAGDDLLLPGALSKIADRLGDDVDVVSSAIVRFDEGGRCTIHYSDPVPSDIALECKLKTPATVFRSVMFSKANEGLCDLGMLCAGDHERFVRLLEMGARFACTDTPLVLMREGGISTTRVLDVVLPEDESIAIRHGVPVWKAKLARIRRSLRFRVARLACLRSLYRSIILQVLTDEQLSDLGLCRRADGTVHWSEAPCPE